MRNIAHCIVLFVHIPSATHSWL